MANCCITNNIGVQVGCDDSSVAGISKAWIANRKDISGFQIVPETGHVAGFTMCPNKCFYELQALREAAGFTEEITTSRGRQRSNNSYEVSFYANTPAEIANVRNSFGGEFVIIYKDMNGKFFIVGVVNALQHDTGSFTTGQALDDENGWTITLSSTEPSRIGGHKALQVLGLPTDTQAVLNAATEQWLTTGNRLCSQAEAGPCGCAGE